MAPPEEVQADIAELRFLLQSATRPRVQELLQREIEGLEQGATSTISGSDDASMHVEPPAATAEPSAGDEVAHPDHTPVVPLPAPVLLQSEKAPVALSYSPVASFSWDQDSEKVKIYFFLEGAAKERVELDVRPQAVDVRMHDVGAPGRHLRFGVPQLHAPVDPAASRVLVKPNRVTVILKKKSNGHWLDIHNKEDKLKPKADSSKDPMAGIMDLMKNMYDDGDEEMKKTIAKAWSESQSGKMKDPMAQGFP